MTFETERQQRNVVTLVIRLWPVGTADDRRGVRYQVTHVQSGQVLYFRSVEGLNAHLEQLQDRLVGAQRRVPAGSLASGQADMP